MFRHQSCSIFARVTLNYIFSQDLKFHRKLSSFNPKRFDPKDNLFSNKVTFEDIGVSEILSSALKHLNYINATPIQEMSYNAILSGKDVIMGSETGK